MPQGLDGRVARSVAGPGSPEFGTVGQTIDRASDVADGSTSPADPGAASCAATLLEEPTAALGDFWPTCADDLASTAHAAWVHVLEAEALGSRARANERAAERRATQRQQARTAAKRKAARERAEQRAKARRAEERAKARRAEARQARERLAERRAARKAAERKAAQQAAQRAKGTSRSSGANWRNAPIVTWYGPGFYGNRTACGVKYTRQIVGVAHRTLPCGTLVQFKWHGITAVAPVIDRGPFASSAYVFDFSAALSCDVFKPRRISNSCFTRYDVKYRVVGRVALRSYLRRQ